MNNIVKAELKHYPLKFVRMCPKLEKTIGYVFKNKLYLYIALTHSSFSNEKKVKVYFECNERQEFLGDSILSLVMAERIFEDFTEYPEGDLTKLRASLVCEDALYEYAHKIDLGSYLLLGHGEESGGGRERKSILADCFEALIAAIYLDGGLEAAKSFILKYTAPRLETIIQSGKTKDYKSLLQQIVQNSPGEKLEYVLVAEEGPDHNKVFTSAVKLNSNLIGTGNGKTKRESEQEAARAALVLFGEN